MMQLTLLLPPPSAGTPAARVAEGRARHARLPHDERMLIIDEGDDAERRAILRTCGADPGNSICWSWTLTAMRAMTARRALARRRRI